MGLNIKNGALGKLQISMINIFLEKYSRIKRCTFHLEDYR